MVAANEAVGSFFRKRGATTVWRVHAPPKEERVAQLAELLGAYGIRVEVAEASTPLGMKAVLDQINEKAGAQALSLLVLRTLKQAVWDTVPIGHFGLASGDYLHFTSPIRRYPDLLVHRLLKYHLHRDGQPSGGGYHKPPPDTESSPQLAHTSSGHERRAMEAEREAVSMYRAFLMRDQVGEEFEGTVSAVTSFGAFVELDEPYVEGLIKLDSLGDEAWAYDEVHMRLSGRRTGRSIELGDRVKVEINNVSVVRRRIDFTLIATARSNALRPTLEPSPRAGIAAAQEGGARGRSRGARPGRARRGAACGVDRRQAAARRLASRDARRGRRQGPRRPRQADRQARGEAALAPCARRAWSLRPASARGERFEQLAARDRLGDQRADAEVARAPAVLGVRARRDDHDRRGLEPLVLAQPRDQVEAAELGHLEIGDDEVVAELAGHLERARAVLGDVDDPALAAEHARHRLADRARIVDDERAPGEHHRRRAGIGDRRARARRDRRGARAAPDRGSAGPCRSR